MQDFYSNFNLFFRWLHVIAGIVWIGHLYFFNFVNVPLQGALDDAAKKAVNPQLLPRALWWFRWGGMITFLAGIVLFTSFYMYTPGAGFGPTSLFNDAEGLTARAKWILLGMSFGTIMWFNVWFIIWPAQKGLLTGKIPAAGIPAVRKRALMASRINTFLSAPMLFGMLAPAHYGGFNAASVLGTIILGVVAVAASIRSSYKVGKLARD
ncbi:MAG: urate hydroxylase PuuD [Candidatus Omnitrophica bacterium]|nr:urate hydroxylase PuuD [Candidatus Omnitrophota bacterium]